MMIVYDYYRRNGQRTVDEMQKTIVEIESKFKSESSRLKKKYETEHREMEMQLDNLNRGNAELAKANKSLAIKLKVSHKLTDHKDGISHILFTNESQYILSNGAVSRVIFNMAAQ